MRSIFFFLITHLFDEQRKRWMKYRVFRRKLENESGVSERRSHKKKAFRRSNWSWNESGVVLNRGLEGVVFPRSRFMQPAGERSPAQHPRTGMRQRLPFALIFATRSARLAKPPARRPRTQGFLYPWSTLS